MSETETIYVPGPDVGIRLVRNEAKQRIEGWDELFERSTLPGLAHYWFPDAKGMSEAEIRKFIVRERARSKYICQRPNLEEVITGQRGLLLEVRRGNWASTGPLLKWDTWRSASVHIWHHGWHLRVRLVVSLKRNIPAVLLPPGFLD